MREPHVTHGRTLAVALALLLAAACTPGAPEPVPTPSQPPVERTEGAVSAEAVVAPQSEAILAFEAAGRVVEVAVVEGDTVAEGQVLARLDPTDLSLAVEQAEAALKSAEAELARVKAGPRPEDIAPAAAAVTIAETNVRNAEEAVKVREAAVTAAQAAVGVAQARLRRVQAGATAREIMIAEKEVERVRNELWALQKQRDASFNILEGQLAAAEVAVRIAELQLEQLKAGARTEDIALARAEVTQAEAAVVTAEVQVEQASAQVETGRAQLAQAKAERDRVAVAARAEDIAIAEAAVSQADLVVKSARGALEDAVLVAPFEGTIGSVLIERGALASPQIPAVQLGDLSRWHVETEDLSEVDISRVQAGQPATVTLDALDGQTFRGRVLRVLPVAGERRGDKVYTVTIELDDAADAALRWGMSALAEIETE